MRIDLSSEPAASGRTPGPCQSQSPRRTVTTISANHAYRKVVDDPPGCDVALPASVRAAAGRHHAAAQPGDAAAARLGDRQHLRHRRRGRPQHRLLRAARATPASGGSAASAPTSRNALDPGLRADRRRRPPRPASSGCRSSSSGSRHFSDTMHAPRHGGDRADGPPGRHAARRQPGAERADDQPRAARDGPGRHRRLRAPSTPSPRGCPRRVGPTASSCTSTTTTCTSGSSRR